MRANSEKGHSGSFIAQTVCVCLVKPNWGTGMLGVDGRTVRVGEEEWRFMERWQTRALAGSWETDHGPARPRQSL